MKTRIWILLLCALLLLSLIGSLFVLWPRDAAAYAQITSGGTVVATLDLTKNDSLTVAIEDGYNYLTVKDGKIAVTEASCPDHYCMDRGFCQSGTPIVCLPNGLIIEFLDDQEIDAAVG